MDGFTKYSKGGLTQAPTNLNLVQTHVEFGTTPWVMGHHLVDEVSCDLLVDKTSDFQCLKDEMTFALLAKVSSHKVAIVDELNNVPKLDGILHGVNIGQ